MLASTPASDCPFFTPRRFIKSPCLARPLCFMMNCKTFFCLPLGSSESQKRRALVSFHTWGLPSVGLGAVPWLFCVVPPNRFLIAANSSGVHSATVPSVNLICIAFVLLKDRTQYEHYAYARQAQSFGDLLRNVDRNARS